MGPEGTPRRGRPGAGILPAGIALVAAAVFVRVLGHGFLGWDDLRNVAENPHLNPPTWAGTLHLWGHAYADLYVPLTFTAWALLARATFEPWIFHAASLAVHAAAAVAAFRLLSKLVPSAPAACAGALLFALHPLQAETVGWMSGLKDLLSGLFGVLALSSYVELARGRRASFLPATILFLLALLSKPSAVAVPAIAAVLDLAVLRRRPREVAPALAPWFAIAAGWSLLARAAQPAAGVVAVPLAARILVAGDALAFYAGKLVWPLGLAPDYGRAPEVVLAGGPAWIAGAAAILLVLAAAIVVLRGQGGPLRALAVGILLAVAGVAPVLGLVPFDFQRYSTVADHYLYLAMLGPAWAAADLLSGRARAPALAAAGAALLLLAILAFRQAGFWRDDETLWLHTLEVNGKSWTAEDNLGQALARQGRREEAVARFERALEIRPRDARAQYNLGTTLDELDRTGEAIPHLERAVELDPMDLPSRENLAIALLRADRVEEAEANLRRALAIDPDAWLAHYYLAGALDRLGRSDEVIEQLRETVRLRPGFRPAQKDLEAVLAARGAEGK
jgi:Flp pilus assembly protein TadD